MQDIAICAYHLTMKTIKIFLASSEELKAERLQMADLVGHLNTVLSKQGIIVQLVEWEYLDSSMGPLHKQEEYNRELRDCEMCLVLYWTRFGMYTKIELDTAFKGLCDGHNPKKLYVYFKDATEISAELKEFRDSFPEKYGHFSSRFANVDTLKADFLLQLMDYLNLYINGNNIVEIKNSQVSINGKAYVELKNVPFAGNNETYNRLLKEIAKTRKLLAITATDDPDYSEYANDLIELEKQQAQMENGLWDTALLITKLSTAHCSERLQRAMELFNKGDNKGAQAILNEEEIEKDVRHNLHLIELGEEGKKGLKTNIEEYQLKIKTLANEMPEGWIDTVISLYKRVAELTIAAYGEVSPELAVCYNNWAMACSNRSLSEALSLQEKAVMIYEKVYGTNHAETAVGYLHLGQRYRALCRYDDAISYIQKALDINLANLGECHENTADAYLSLGCMYDDIGNYDSALKNLNKALDIYIHLFGEISDPVSITYDGIGSVYGNMRDYDKGLEYEQKAVPIKIQVWGKSDPSLASSYNNIAWCYGEKGDYDTAMKYDKMALDIQLKCYGRNNLKTGASYDNIGWNLTMLRRYSEALDYLQAGLQSSKAVTGEVSVEVSYSLENIGNLYYNSKNYLEAVKYYQEALDVLLKTPAYNYQHKTSYLYRVNLAKAYEKTGDLAKALENVLAAKEIHQLIPDLEDTKDAELYERIQSKLGR